MDVMDAQTKPDRKARPEELKALRTIRVRLGVRLTEVAATGIISASTLSEWERGIVARRRPVTKGERDAVRDAILRIGKEKAA